MKRTLYTTLLCSALLTACGGGGGSADEQAPLSAIDSSSSVVTNSSSSGATDPTSSGVTGGAANTAPVASAGADLGVLVGSLATLDGSASSDADGDTLTYSWALASSPTGSSASLSGANAVSPSFTPDVAGPYVVSLTVNDGTVASAADNVTVNAAIGNAAPVANAGADQNVNVGAMVTLDGSASTDANGDTLSYTWAFVSTPVGSSASLSGSSTVNPTFTADIEGEYVVGLTVNDGTVDSASDSVTVNAAVGNAAPVANAGDDQNVNVGASVMLGGSGSSDADGDTLTYAWVFVSAPANSSASLSDANVVNPSFTADLEGEYVLSLTVNDGTVDSTADSVTINATVGSTAPVGFGDAPELVTAPSPLEIINGVSTCNGYLIANVVVDANLVVPAGELCVLDNDTVVKGSITLGASSELYVRGARLEGKVSGDGAAVVVIEGSTLFGNVQLDNGLQITLRNNVIEGWVKASGNTGLVYLNGNELPTGFITLSSNTGGVTVIGNQMLTELSCDGNDPAPTGSDNVAASRLDQCAGL